MVVRRRLGLGEVDVDRVAVLLELEPREVPRVRGDPVGRLLEAVELVRVEVPQALEVQNLLLLDLEEVLLLRRVLVRQLRVRGDEPLPRVGTTSSKVLAFQEPPSA